jgi:hypothetical protein
MKLHVAVTLALALLGPGCDKKDDAAPASGAAQQAPAASGSVGAGNRPHDREHEWDGGGREGHERPPK